jgi:DNA-binding CsgD family transcriptional regulator
MAGGAIWTLGAVEMAEPVRVAAIGLIETGNGDFPGCSNELTVARMATLLGRSSEAGAYFDLARAKLQKTGQAPLRAITDFDQALALQRTSADDQDRVERLLDAAQAAFQALGMEPWVQHTAGELTKVRGARPSQARPGGLTERELEVLHLILRGYSDRQIAETLFVSPRTVNAHLRNMLGKTSCTNRTELSVWAIEQDLT